MIDPRAFGPGERIVFEQHTRDVFEQTHKWTEDWKLFPRTRRETPATTISCSRLTDHVTPR
jgi:hypothetical protein